MPNWCEGKLKLRGEPKDIIRFLSRGLKARGEHSSESNKFRYTIKAENGFDVIGMARAFIMDSEITYYRGSSSLALPYSQAWSIPEKELAAISKKYKLDFKIYAFECGSETNYNIEVIKDNIIKAQTIKFKDYWWECVDPTLGGLNMEKITVYKVDN